MRPAPPRHPRHVQPGKRPPTRAETPPQTKAGRPHGAPSTLVHRRLPRALLAQLDRSSAHLAEQTGLKAHRGMLARRALPLFLRPVPPRPARPAGDPACGTGALAGHQAPPPRGLPPVSAQCLDGSSAGRPASPADVTASRRARSTSRTPVPSVPSWRSRRPRPLSDWRRREGAGWDSWPSPQPLWPSAPFFSGCLARTGRAGGAADSRTPPQRVEAGRAPRQARRAASASGATDTIRSLRPCPCILRREDCSQSMASTVRRATSLTRKPQRSISKYRA